MKTLAVLGIAAVMACDAPGSPENRTRGPGEASEAPAVGTESELALAYRAPASVVDAGRGALELGGQVIEIASALSNAGSARTYGTLTETADGRLSYEPQPADRIVVERAGGQRFEVMVFEIAGGGQDVTTFLQGDHVLRLHITGEAIDAEVRSSRRGSAREAGIRGRLSIDGDRLGVDLTLRGTETFDSDRSGSRLFDDHDLAGTIMRGADRIEVLEHWTYELVSARGATESRMETASSVVRNVQSTMELAGRRIEWRNVRTKKAFRNGKPNELDTFWEGTGEVRENTVLVGRVEKFAEAYGESGGFVGFQIETGGGPVELERHAAY